MKCFKINQTNDNINTVVLPKLKKEEEKKNSSLKVGLRNKTIEILPESEIKPMDNYIPREKMHTNFNNDNDESSNFMIQHQDIVLNDLIRQQEIDNEKISNSPTLPQTNLIENQLNIQNQQNEMIFDGDNNSLYSSIVYN